VDFFTKEIAQGYDDRNRKLATISENAHFLIGLILGDLPADARVLCIGVGTGAEILPLAKANPGWTFVGVDPSEAMLAVCRTRLAEAGVLSRCELIHGYLEDAPRGESFDAAISMLVGHFIAPGDRRAFYGGMAHRLKTGGQLVNCEISFDLDSADFAPMLVNWKRVQVLMGATAESLTNLEHTLRTVLSIRPPGEIEDLLRQSGVEPVRFFQAFLILGWHGRK